MNLYANVQASIAHDYLCTITRNLFIFHAIHVLCCYIGSQFFSFFLPSYLTYMEYAPIYDKNRMVFYIFERAISIFVIFQLTENILPQRWTMNMACKCYNKLTLCDRNCFLNGYYMFDPFHSNYYNRRNFKWDNFCFSSSAHSPTHPMNRCVKRCIAVENCNHVLIFMRIFTFNGSNTYNCHVHTRASLSFILILLMHFHWFGNLDTLNIDNKIEKKKTLTMAKWQNGKCCCKLIETNKPVRIKVSFEFSASTTTTTIQ